MARIRSIKPELWKANKDAWGFAKSNLYVIREAMGQDGPTFVKIGIAGHPVRRWSQLQCGNPRHLGLVAVYAGDAVSCAQIERQVLRKFKAVSREWIFANVDDVLGFLKSFEGEE